MKLMISSAPKRLPLKIIGIFAIFVIITLTPKSFPPTKIARAVIPDCEKEEGLNKDRCYEQKAQSVEGCQKISSKDLEKQCINKFTEAFTEYNRCDPLPIESKGDCYAFVTLNKYPDSIDKCYELLFSYQEDCIRTYINRKRVDDPNYCYNVKQSFRKECAYQATLNRYPLFGGASKGKLNESACNEYKGEIKEGCLSYVQFFSLGKKFLFGFGGMMLLLMLSPIIVTFVVLIVVILLVKKNKLLYPPSKARVAISIILNTFIFPGMGTILAGDIRNGIPQAAISSLGLLTAFVGIGFILFFASWVWALFISIKMWRDSSKTVS